MPDAKISDLVDGGLPQPTDEFVVARGTTNNKLAWSSLSTSFTQSVQTQNVHNVTLSGNTAGVMAQVSSGTLSLAGGNNITLSQNGNAVTISGANAGGAQTGISGISASDTLYTSGTVRITGVGGGVTVSSNTGQRIDISVAAPVAQSVQTQNVVDVTLSGNTAGALALVSSGTLSLAGGNGITLSQAGNAVTISGVTQSAQTFIGGISASDTLYTSGSVRITGVGGGVTVSSNTGQRVDISVAAPVAQTNQAGSVYAISNTSGTSSGTYDARTLSIAGAGIITVAASNSGWRIDASTAAQTNQAGGVYASSNTFGTSSGTYDARSISIAGRGAVSVAASNSGWVISAPVQSTQVETQTFIAGISASDTLYTSGNVRISGSNAVTVKSGTGQLVIIDVPVQSTQPETQTFIAGISASDTLYTSGNVRITGVGGGVTVSSNTGQRIDISVAAPVAQTVQTQNVVDVTLSGNTAGAMALVSSGTLTLAGGNNITLSQAGNAVTISGGAGGAAMAIADWQNYPVGLAVQTGNVSDYSKRPFYWADIIPGGITAKSLVFRISQITGTQPNSFSVHLGVYTKVNSTSAALLGSLSEEFVVSSASSASFTGVRNYAITGIGTHGTLSTLSGGEYMFGMMVSATATQVMNFGLYQISIAQAPIGVVYPGTNNLSVGTSQGAMALWGRGSTTVDNMPANVVASELINQGAGVSMQIHPWIYIRS